MTPDGTPKAKKYYVTVTQSFTVEVQAMCETDARYIAENNETIRQQINEGLAANGIEITDVQEADK